MTNFTRRKLLRNGGLAAGAAALITARPGKIAGESKMENVFHVFAFQWKQQAAEVQKERAARDVLGFQGVIC
jgi:hypothetical protein